MSFQQRHFFAMNPSKINTILRRFTVFGKKHGLLRQVGVCIQDRRGQSGIEFALVLPLMAVLVAGTMDLGMGLMIKRKVNQIASSTSDILAQEDMWSSSDVMSILNGEASALYPFDTTNLKIVVSVLDFDEHGKATVSWSKGFQDDGLVNGSAWMDPVPEPVIETDVQLVATHVEYYARSALTGLLAALTGIETYSFSGSAIARPRVGDRVRMQ